MRILLAILSKFKFIRSEEDKEYSLAKPSKVNEYFIFNIFSNMKYNYLSRVWIDSPVFLEIVESWVFAFLYCSTILERIDFNS